MGKGKILALAIWIAIFLGFFFYRANVFIRENSATFDEAVHLTAGYSYWKRGYFRLNHETPPLSKLVAALPLYMCKNLPFNPKPEVWEQGEMWQISNDFVFRSELSPQEMLAWGRWANCSLGLCLVCLIGWWAYRRFGTIRAGCAAFALACTEPNLLAYSCLVNNDMCLTLFTFASAYCSWEYFRSRKRIWFVFSGIAIGLSLASKFSALFFLPGLLLCWFLLLRASIVTRSVSEAERSSSLTLRVNIDPVNRVSEAERSSSLTLRVNIDPVNRDSKLSPSEIFQTLFRLVLIASLTVLPCYFFVQFQHFGQGFKQQLVRHDFDPPEFFLLGEVSTTGWYTYFIYVLGFKVHALIWILFLSVCAIQAWRKQFLLCDSLLLVPGMIFFTAMSVLKVDLGIRIILPVIPFLLVWSVYYIHKSTTRLLRTLQIVVAVLLLFQIVSHLEDYGLELSYPAHRGDEGEVVKNILIERLGDSNLDWGQDLIRLKKWMDDNGQKSIYLAYTGTAPAEAYGIDFIALPGWGRLSSEPYPATGQEKPRYVAVSVSCLQGLHLKDRDMYRFLLSLEPVNRLGGAIWVYDLQASSLLQDRIEKLAEQVVHGQ